MKSIDMLKNPDSFLLHGGHYLITKDKDKGKERVAVVLEISGQNGFGGHTTSYEIFLPAEKGDDWDYWGGVDNLAKKMAESIINKGGTLDRSAIKRINRFFKEDKLEDIEPITPKTK